MIISRKWKENSMILYKRILKTLLLILYFNQHSNAQDTIFIQSYLIPDYISNIDSDGKQLIARGKNHIYILKNEKFIALDKADKKLPRFTWITRNQPFFSIFHTNYPITGANPSQQQIDQLIPGRYKFQTTQATMGDHYFLCYNGQILKYKIYNFYSLVYKGKSIRSTLEDGNNFYTATYGGIFLDTNRNFDKSITIKGSTYSSGELNKIGYQIFLNQDDLYILKDNTWQLYLKSTGKNKFRKTTAMGDKILCLTEYSIGYIISKKYAIIYESNMRLTDVEIFNNTVFTASEDGSFRVFIKDSLQKTIFFDDEINDITIYKSQIILSCRSGLRILDSKTLIELNYYPINDCIQSLFFDEKTIVTSTFNGLFIVSNGKIYNILINTEFNRHALSLSNNMLYAGSTEGLFCINADYLFFNIIPKLSPIKIVENPTYTIWIMILSVLLLSSLIILYYLLRKKKPQEIEKYTILKKKEFNPEILTKIIIENNIISVEELAEKCSISKVHLTRILQKHQTTPLLVLKEAKKQIIQKLINQNKSLDEISIKVGYSIRFIKKNFINKD